MEGVIAHLAAAGGGGGVPCTPRSEPQLEIRPLGVECPSPEPSRGGDEVESSSREDDAASSSSEESSSDENSVEAAAKRDEWVVSSDRGVKEVKGEEEGFEPAPL